MIKKTMTACILRILGLFFVPFHYNNAYSFSLHANIHPILTFTTGASSSQLKQSQTFQPIDLCIYSYKAHSNPTNNVFGGFVGSEMFNTNAWTWVTGVSYYQLSPLTVRGVLIQGADLSSNETFNYNYQIKTQQILTEGKLYSVQNKLSPFLMLGLGASINKVAGYQTNVPPFLQFTPAFSNHIQTNLTYALGAGIDVPLSKSFQVGVAYRFTNLGMAMTGNAQLDGIAITNKLQQSHVYTNQLLAQFTFIPWIKN